MAATGPKEVVSNEKTTKISSKKMQRGFHTKKRQKN